MNSAPDISPDLLERVDALAARTELTRVQILETAIRGYLDAREREATLVAERVAQADRQEFASAEDIERVRTKYEPKTG
jgi:predicted transcriptional regulator